MKPQITNKDFAGIGLLMAAFLVFVLIDIVAFVIAMVLESQNLLQQTIGVYGGIFLYAFIVGQLGVLAVWATIGPNLWGIRWPICTSMLFIGFNAIILCMYASMPWFRGPDLDMFLRANLMLPLVFLASQSPIWLAGILIGWRIRIPDRRPSTFGNDVKSYLAKQKPNNAFHGVMLSVLKPLTSFAFGDQEKRSFGILDILVLMVYLSAALAMAKASVESQNAVEGLSVAVMMSMYCLMWMLMFAVPALLAVLLPNHTRGTASVLFLYFFGMFAVPSTLIWLFAGTVSFEVIGGIAMFMFGCSTSYVTFLLLLKAFGFVLEIRVGKTSNVLESPFQSSVSPFAPDNATVEQAEHLYQNLDAHRPNDREGSAPATQPPFSSD